MKIRDFCSREVVTIEPGASLREASVVMRSKHVGALVVVEAKEDGPHPVGIITDRDIVVAVLAIPGARPEGIRVVDLMSQPLALAREDDGVFEAVQAMSARGVRRLPVVAQNGALRGIVTADDIQRVVSSEMAGLAVALKRGADREALERRLDLFLSRAEAK